MLRLSLRAKDRAVAMRPGLWALVVFEDLLRMETQEALKHVLRRLIDEQLLRPEAMRDDNLARRRALGAVAAKLMGKARGEFNVNAMFPSLFEELAHFNRATGLGEQRYERAAQQNAGGSSVGLLSMHLRGRRSTCRPSTNIGRSPGLRK
jgi:hypothetical protein